MPRYRKPAAHPLTGINPPEYESILPKKYLADGELNPEAITYYRALHDLSAHEFAQFLGVERTSVYFWENGHRRPRHGNLVKLHQLMIGTDRLLLANGGLSVPHDKQLKRMFDSEVNEDWLREILFGVAQMGDETHKD